MPILNLFGCDLSLFSWGVGKHYGSLALGEEADYVLNFAVLGLIHLHILWSLFSLLVNRGLSLNGSQGLFCSKSSEISS